MTGKQAFRRVGSVAVRYESLSLVGGLVSIVVGFILAAGLMFYRAVFEDTEYTTESWIAVPLLWLALGVLWTACFRWSYGAMTATIGLAVFVSLFFSDVYGHYAIAVLLLFCLVKVARETFDG